MARYIVADTETTGVSKDAKICEVAWKEIDADLNEIAHGYSLIDPEIPIPYAAAAVNGITDAMVKYSPTIEEYMLMAGHPLFGEDVVLIAHNAAFDHRYLSPFMHDDARTICTLKCSRVVWPEADNHKQATLAYMLGIEVAREKAHSADGDLDVLLGLVRHLCEAANCTLADLLDIQNTPRTILKMPFGMHKGTLLADLPRSYQVWMRDTAKNLDPDLRESLLAVM